MYMSSAQSEPVSGQRPAPALRLAVLVAVGGTLLLGLFPSRVLEAALRSVAALLG
jgi:hypothetical protein